MPVVQSMIAFLRNCRHHFKSSSNAKCFTRINTVLSCFGCRYRAYSEPVIEDEEVPVRYFPQNFQAVCTETGFSPKSMRRLYRGFKTDCPSGLVIKKDSENPQLAAG